MTLQNTPNLRPSVFRNIEKIVSMIESKIVSSVEGKYLKAKKAMYYNRVKRKKTLRLYIK